MSDPVQPKKERRVSVYSLEKETGARGEDISRWMRDAGFDPLNLAPEKHDEFVRIIMVHRNKKVRSGEGRKPHLDKDGLTWSESKQRQESRKLTRENDIAEKIMCEDWMATSAHHQILSALMTRLESVPDKAKSELELTAKQHKGLLKILDEARNDAAAETRKALLDAKKRIKEASK